ncbi:helix-turn-helix transcriptional regulator [Microtetraspora glauca]|uniref:AAA family ATPase n=1 Tax=Microtetraspora glauca TaxID=1996 RepID=A0ABV3GBD0_MICGL
MRACEEAAVAGVLERAGTGEDGVLLIDGEPGTGKSTLLTRAAAQASTRGFGLATGGAEELDRLIPLNPILSAFDDMPAEDDPASEGLETRLERLRIHMEKRMATGPLLVTLDDLHWADPATLMAVRTLQCRLSSRPLAWILARSTGGQRHEAERLFDVLERHGAHRMTLGPLPDEAVARIVADLLDARPEPELLAFASGAGGNPYLLVELVDGLRDEGAVEVAGGCARLLSPVLPRRVRVLVRHRLDGLGREARHLVEAAAVLGRSFSPDDVSELLGASPAMLLPALEEALAAGLLVAVRDDLAFRHELVWRAVLTGLPRPLRLALCHQAERCSGRADRLGGPDDFGRFGRFGHFGHGGAGDRDSSDISEISDGVAAGQERFALALLLADARRPDEARSLLGTAPATPPASATAPAPAAETGWTDADRARGQAVLRARTALASGRLDEAAADARTCLRADGTPATGLIGSLAASVLVTVALRRGDLRAALAHAPARSPGHPSVRACPGGDDLIRSMASGRVTEAGEGAERAMEQMLRDDVYSGLARHPWVLAGEPGCAVWLVRVALRTGDLRRAELVATALDRLPAGHPGVPRAGVSHARGLIDGDPRALALAADRAADPWSRASAEEDLGVLLCRTGDQAAGIESLNRALAGYGESAATRDTARVRRRLRQEGVRRRHWSYADRPVTGWDSLTDTERAVSLLVAQGWTNRQVAEQMFISVHTVAFHLRQIFRKLDIRSRVELTRLAVEHSA